MRFLFECVGCCMMTSNSSSEPSSPAETRSLVSPPERTGHRRRRKAASAATDWRPSLFAISEDASVALASPGKKVGDSRNKKMGAGGGGGGGQRVVKRSCGPGSVRVGNARSGHMAHDYSCDPAPIVVPAFSAAPFMF